MTQRLFAATLSIALGVAGAAFATGMAKTEMKPTSKPEMAAEKFKKLTVAELSALQKDKQATVVDANDDATRAKYGIIPNAVLIDSSSKYDVAKTLPAQKDHKVVFYCANTQCLASHAAAERAVQAGYTDVAVLPEGIMGWKRAGMPTQAMPKS